MKEIMYLGSVPANEPCAQVGAENYFQDAHVECKRYIEQLREQFGPEPFGARLTIKGSHHEFGTYYEVVCEYDPNSPEAVDYAFDAEGEAWGEWEANKEGRDTQEVPTMAKPTQTQELEEILKGWTISRVLPCQRSESLFTLELTKDGQTKQLDLYATDLGWWHKASTTDHDWVRFGRAAVQFCNDCGITDGHPQAKDPCCGILRDWA